MARQTVAPPAAPAPAPEGKQVTIDEAEFVRTRDAVVTSWTRLHGALQGAIQAYIDHSNSVLEGHNALTHSGLNVLVNLATATAPTAQHPLPEANGEAVPSTEDADVKVRKRKAKAPKDPNAPKKPVTAYLQFLQVERPSIQADLARDTETGQKRGDISVEGTARWKALTEERQEYWKGVYREKFEEYRKALEVYKAINPDAQLEAEPADPEVDVPAKKKPGRKPKAVEPDIAPSAAAVKPAPSWTSVAPETATAPDDADSSSAASSPEPSETSSDDSDSENDEARARTTTKDTGLATKQTKTPIKAAAAKKTAAAVSKSAASLADKPEKKLSKNEAPTTSDPLPTPAATAPSSSPSKKRKPADKELTAGPAEAPSKSAKKRKSTAGEGVDPATAAPSTPAAQTTEKKERKRKRKSGVPEQHSL